MAATYGLPLTDGLPEGEAEVLAVAGAGAGLVAAAADVEVEVEVTPEFELPGAAAGEGADAGVAESPDLGGLSAPASLFPGSPDGAPPLKSVTYQPEPLS